MSGLEVRLTDECDVNVLVSEEEEKLVPSLQHAAGVPRYDAEETIHHEGG